MRLQNPTDLVGNTPVVFIESIGNAHLWAKLEGHNPTGSLKDRTAKAIVADAVKRKTNKRLLDATSGSFGCALAYLGRLAGLSVSVVVNSKISNDNLAFLKTQGAEVIPFGDVTGESREHCLELVDADPEKWLFVDQLTNPLAPDIHERTTAVEIMSDIPSVQSVIGSKGSGATLCGVSRYIAKQNKEVRVFGSIGAPGQVKKVAGTYVEGADFVSPFIDELTTVPFYEDVIVTYEQAMEWCLEFPVLIGPQGGGVYQAARIAVENNNLSGDVVMILGDTLLKNASRFL